MALFVINEWIWADSSGANGQDALNQVVSLIEQFAVSEHQLIIVLGSAFDKKAWAACKSKNLRTVLIARDFVVRVRQNLSRARIVRDDSLAELPEDLAALVKPDDRYLVRAQRSVPGAILVTKDTKLRDIVKQHGLPAIPREEFLSTYFKIPL